MMDSIKVLLIFLSLLKINFVSSDIRIWTKTISLGDARQWSNGRLPCKGQSIIIPEEVISVPKTFNFGPETILPNNGMLLFDKSGNIVRVHVKNPVKIIIGF